ncbi:hypothetical protein JCM1841_001045 [Sporobolomyces salmonicolor]
MDMNRHNSGQPRSCTPTRVPASISPQPLHAKSSAQSRHKPPSPARTAANDSDTSSDDIIIDGVSYRPQAKRARLLGPARITASTSQAAWHHSPSGSDDGDVTDLSSSSSVDIVSGASSTSEDEATAGPGPSTLRARSHSLSPRHVRTRNAATGDSPTSPSKGVDIDCASVPHDYPLPRLPWEFDVANYAPTRHPAPPAGWMPEKELSEAEKQVARERAEEGRKRTQLQRRLREPEGERWEWEWVQEVFRGPHDSKGKGKEMTVDYHTAAFFPYSNFEGLEWLDGVFAAGGGTTVELLRASGASSNAGPEILASTISTNTRPLRDPNREEYFTCAWSVNTTTWPFTPLLAVAGRGRVIEIYLVGRRRTGEVVLHLDRTITGHGGSVFHLTFHPSRPHLLLSSSEDRTLRLWDPTLPWGSDAAVLTSIEAERARKAHAASIHEEMKQAGPSREAKRGGEAQSTRRRPRFRPRIEGELLAILAEGGHERGVLSCDFHSTFPLVVSCGMDGRVKIWQLPSHILSLTPSWPSPNTSLYNHPPSPPPFSHPPLLGPPIFSSLFIHAGQWPDQVVFASSTTCSVLSKAPVTHRDTSHSPRTSVKLWTPDVLDVLPNRLQEEWLRVVDRADSRTKREREKRALPEVKSLKPKLPLDERDELGFRVEREAVVEGQNCVADTMGWVRPAVFRENAGAEGGVDNLFFVLSTSTAIPPNPDPNCNPALYFFRPFAPTPFPPKPTMQPSQPAFASSSKPTPPDNPIVRLASALFPPDRERPRYDFTPRLLPSLVVDLPSPPSSRLSPTPISPPSSEGLAARDSVSLPASKATVLHFRCVAVQPNGAGWVVGVGDGGVKGCWRRKLAGEGGQGRKGDDSGDPMQLD